MKKFYLLLFLLFIFTFSYGQMFVESGTSIHVEESLYIDEILTNNGSIIFSTTGDLYLDQGLDNSSGTLTLNDAILHLGSGQGRASGTHDLIFNNSDDEVKFVELGKNSGTLTVLNNSGSLIIKETFTSNAGTLQANDKVVLKAFTTSDPDPDYDYPDQAVIPNSSGGTVEGLRVEKFFPARRAFRFVGSSVTTDTPSSTTIRENWQEDPTDYQDSTPANFGTHISGVAPLPNVDAVPSDDGTNGFDYTPSGNASMFTYDSSNNVWNNIANTNTNTLTAGDAYRLLVRGDRSVDITTASPTPTDTKLRSTGTAIRGNVDISVNNASGAFNFIANPYHSVVDMKKFIDDNTVSGTFYIWDPNLGGDPGAFNEQGGRGAYVAVTPSNTGETTQFTNPSGNSSGATGSDVTEMTKFLQPYQAFFIENSGTANSTVTFKESHKATGNLTQVFSDNNPQHFIQMNLYDANSYNNNDTPDDGISLYFNANYSNTIDSNDALKFFNIDENLATDNNGSYFCIEKRAMPQVDETIPLLTYQYRDTDYLYKINVGSFPDNDLYLQDNYTGDLHLLNEDAINTISFTVDQNIDASVAMDRFAFVFQETFSQEDFEDAFNLQIYPNPVTDNQFNILSPELAGKTVNMTIADLSGRVIDQQQFSSFDRSQTVKPSTALSTGVYLIKLESEGQQVDKKLIVE